MKFSSPMEYAIGYCTGLTSLPVQPPNKVDKMWTIRKTATALNIECNGVEVLNYLFSDSSNSECVTNWGGDAVEKIQFYPDDTASDGYRAMPATGKNYSQVN